jgi:signal transduction histidine kinase
MSIAAKPNSSPVEILIAEDSPTQAKKLQHILEQQGYEVSIGINGLVALEMAQRHKPTLIISDVVMPEMDGYELCQRVKSDEALGDVPVILVTSLSDPHDVIRGLECRADNFILKPYDESYLLGSIQFVLVNREMRRADQPGLGLEIYFEGQKYFISADRLQILNLLLSTYEAAMQRNKQLSLTQDTLQQTNSELQQLTVELEHRVLQRTQELRLYSDKLERSNRELQDFAQVASHDLQEPLRKILSFGDRLKSKACELLDGECQDYLERMTNAAARMQSLITDLLTFSRVETKGQPFVPTDLGVIAREVSGDLETRIEQAGGRVEIEELPTIDADPMQMRQLLQNLIGNSLKYYRVGVPPVVRIYSQKLDARSPESMDESALARKLCQILVVDNGIGFDEKYLDRIFTIFQRLHKKGEYEGTGVGLAICRKIVDRHGGSITARSSPGEGATFVVTLPVLQSKEVEILSDTNTKRSSTVAAQSLPSSSLTKQRI